MLCRRCEKREAVKIRGIYALYCMFSWYLDAWS